MADGGPVEVVQQINQAWRTGDVRGIWDLFHPDAVIVHPDWEERTEGREACVDSYSDFAQQALVRRLEEFDGQADVVGETAVVSNGFEIDYELDGQLHQDSGTDLFVLVHGRRTGWQVIWRTIIMDAD